MELAEALRARVSQLAGVRDVDAGIVLQELSLGDTSTESSWVPLKLVEESLGAHTPRKDPSELRDVIKATFAAARGTREDWQSMPLPVLKNRLLALTNGVFHEWDYGWPNLRFLPRAYPDLLELDASNRHGAARYIASPPPSSAEPGVSARPVAQATPRRGDASRIREDLWDAAVDYRSGLTYVWDPVSERAVGVEAADAGTRNIFPTIQPEVVREWRAECARKWIALNGDAGRDSVEAWVDNPRTQVSHRFVETWRADQREHVASLITDFFEKSSIELPQDAFSPTRRAERAGLTAREIVRLSAEVMTDSEIDALQLPLGVVFRSLRHGGHIR